MSRPESVVVGAVTYRITDREEDWRAYDLDSGSPRGGWGAHWPVKAMILVNDNNPVQVQRVTVLHELLHAVVEAASQDENDQLTEERWIEMVDSPLLDTLVRNPDLVAWLLEVER